MVLFMELIGVRLWRKYACIRIPSDNRGRSYIFSSRRRHSRLTCDWSSDVCSSDLINSHQRLLPRVAEDKTRGFFSGYLLVSWLSLASSEFPVFEWKQFLKKSLSCYQVRSPQMSFSS